MEFLSQHDVDFEERNVTQNPGYIRELVKHGSRSTPTTVIGDEVIIGFDRRRLTKILGL